MIFVINNLKYDTDKMELVSEKCEYSYISTLFTLQRYRGKNVKLWRSKKKNNWLLTFEKDFCERCGVSLQDEQVKNLLIRYDIEAYEKIFGELEEA